MARKSLEKLCQKLDVLEIKGVCGHAMEALQVLEKEAIDLIFSGYPYARFERHGHRQKH